jgi:hypothetical protein
MAIEDELRAALLSRAEDLLDAATACIYLAFMTPTDPRAWLSMVQKARASLERAETYIQSR